MLDIGCADSKPRALLPDNAEYIGLDYYDTVARLYHTRPTVFGDAQQLPFPAASVDHVLLLDVLEHLPDPGRCLQEIYRVIKPGGTLTLQVPFMYPIHDAPLDFHRWTRSGLERAAAAARFDIAAEKTVGHPLEAAALVGNIATSKTVLNWISARNPLALLAILLPFLVAARNGIAWVGAKLSRSDDMMPYAYRVVWTKH